MQIKHYTILDGADLTVINTWAQDANHRCYVIAQGQADAVTWSLCVHQPSGMDSVFTDTETALAGLIQETAWPE
jgi:hypothetical protein